MAIFSNTLGLERARRGLIQALSRGRVHHAWLFSGRDGIGKRRLAMQLAKVLNCEFSQVGTNDPDDLKICGHCRHCIRIDALQHPDLEIIEAQGRSIRIEQIRSLQKKVAFKPYEARWRLVIIDDAHTLRIEAANALLKTLEEPTENTLFTVITSQPQRLLPTIISRCQRLRMRAFSEDELRAFLLGRGVPATRAQLASVLAQGSIAEAIVLGDSDALVSRLEYIDAVRDIRAHGIRPALSLAADLGASRDDIPDAFAILRVYFRDLMLIIAGLPQRACLQQQLDRLKDDARRLDVPRIGAIIDALDLAELSISGNVHPQLTLEALLLDLAAIQRGRTPLRPPIK